MPLDVAGLAALVLVASRYNAGQPLIIASPSRDDAAGVVFFAGGPFDEQEDAGVFVSRIQTEMDESRRHAPVPIASAGAALGIDPADYALVLLQLAFICGSPEDAVTLRDRAGVTVRVERDGPRARVEVTAAPGAFPRSLLSQLASHVARAIAWLTCSSGARVADFELVSAAERREIADVFNDTRHDVPAGLTLDGLVSAQARRTPASTAVICGDVALTYASLDGQANHLAGLLCRDFGVGAGAPVGVMLERSEKTLIALLGVMKAGAAYVPIDPRHPWETVRYMLENAGVRVLIVDSASIATASSFPGELIVIDIELRGSPEAGDPGVAADERALAYVIYTSGSTGRPKGVAVEHRAIVNTVLWRNAFYGIGPSDVNLQIPSFAFDSSVVDMFCVLAAGGTLVVPDEAMRLDARRLIELTAARGVTSCIVTPSYYRLLLTELAGAAPSLRWVTLAGESAAPDLVAAHLTRLPGVALYNEYGPTENAVCSTACRLESAETTVSIGRPIWNVMVVVLDADGRLLPAGVPGEIHLGGGGLARGYLNQDELTAERFIASPVADVCAGVLYRTGDRGCWRPDGSLEFLGRLDSQVKVRGFRVELDEVELALRRHPGVMTAAVICREDSGGAKYLSAYAEAEYGLTRADLRAHMAAEVPYYMVPDMITLMPRLPLNLNGKIDRTALARIDDFAGSASAVDAPLSPVQSTLAGLWADVLKRHVALDDNFFAIGGNSLRVMELTSRIRGELSPGVELLDIYTYPTIRELADRLSGAGV